MTETEKMLAGLPYDWRDADLMALWNKGKNLAREYNALDYSNGDEQAKILDELLAGRGENVQITAPFFVDYGKFIRIGDNSEVNMNCVFLDCNWITIGSNVMIAPGVHIYTVFHPLVATERYRYVEGEKYPLAIGNTAPVTIEDDVWIGGSSILMPGVTIGRGSVIGAGSVVTRSIPERTLAFGNPCRVVRAVE